MRFITRLFLVFTLVLAGSNAVAADGKTPDTLIVDQVEVQKGSGVALEIHFVNDEELAALTIPLRVLGGGYKIDSISFAGSRIEYLSMRPVTIKENKKDVIFGAIVMTEEYIPPGRGLMAKMYLSPTGDEKAGKTVVDTTTIGPASVLFTKTNSASFVPKVRPGAVAIKKAEESGAPQADTTEKKSDQGKEDKAEGKGDE
jgi:hypothetical protein